MIGGPAMTEITLQLRTDGGAMAGNGYATGYGWFNFAYSIGTMFGPLFAGWIVENWSWTVLCFVMGTLAGVTIIPVLIWAGESKRNNSSDTENGHSA
jgi:MFS family permease